MKEINLKSYSKINLFLEIESRRSDGYHNIQSIFARTSLFDRIYMKRRRDKKIRLEIKNNSNLSKIPKEKNLIYKACVAFFDFFKISYGVDVYLEKNIPVGAGLGGGSSNCAVVLKGLSLLYPEAKGDIFRLGALLGSDVPFFMKDYSLARCWGRGEKVKKIEVKAKMPEVLIVWPDEFISTKEAYENFKMGQTLEIKKNIRQMLKFIEELEKCEEKIDFSRYLFNRFESYVLGKYPSVKKIKDIALSFSLPSLMSGSGSSIFIFSYRKKELQKLINKISSLHKFIFLAKFI